MQTPRDGSRDESARAQLREAATQGSGPGDRLERLAEAATRLHLALADRKRLLAAPLREFTGDDGSRVSYPMLTVDEYSARLAGSNVSESEQGAAQHDEPRRHGAHRRSDLRPGRGNRAA